MSSETIYHYVYRITNIIEKKHYYGCRTSKIIIPQNDLGVKYFSCSKDKVFKFDQKENPQNSNNKIKKSSYSQSKYLQTFGYEIIGKTFKELGFLFISK